MKPKTRIATGVGAALLVALLAACATPSTNTTNTAAPSKATTSTTSAVPATTSTQPTSSTAATTSAQGVAAGRTIFDTGMVAGRAIVFTGGTSAVKSKGVAACATCHGTAGKGGQGGPQITWTAIGSKYPTEASFSNAVTKGLGQANAPLDTAMPRYKMTPAEVAAVYAYVKTLK